VRGEEEGVEAKIGVRIGAANGVKRGAKDREAVRKHTMKLNARNTYRFFKCRKLFSVNVGLIVCLIMTDFLVGLNSVQFLWESIFE
jgi:hypothetical protein